LPSQISQVVVPARLQWEQPEPLHLSHFVVPFPWQLGQSFMLRAGSDGSGGSRN
jgi:hypothetical protein